VPKLAQDIVLNLVERGITIGLSGYHHHASRIIVGVGNGGRESHLYHGMIQVEFVRSPEHPLACMLADKGFPFLGHGQEDTATGLNGTDTTAASLEDALAFVAVDLFVPKELGACVVDDEPIRIITHGQVYQRAHRSRLGESHNDTVNLRRLDNIIKLHEVTGTDLAILLRDSHHKQELPVIIHRGRRPVGSQSRQSAWRRPGVL